MVVKFDDTPLPTLSNNWDKKSEQYAQGLTVFRSDQCPYIDDAVKTVVDTAKKLGIESRVVELKTCEDVRIKQMIIRYAFAWLILVVAAIINGAIREGVYKNHLGELRAHQVSTLTGIILFGVIVWGLSRLWPLASAKQAWTVGCIWLAMTIAFEFLSGTKW